MKTPILLAIFILAFCFNVRSESGCLCSTQVLGEPLELVGGIDMQHSQFASIDPEGDRYLVIWDHDDSTKQEVVGKFFDFQGSPTSSDINFYSGPVTRGPFGRRPATAYNSSNKEFLVVWEVRPSLDSCAADLLGQIIDTEGRKKGNPSVLMRNNDCSSPTAFTYLHSVIHNPVSNQYVVGYSDASYSRLFLQRFNAEGRRIGAAVELATPGNGRMFEVHIRHNKDLNRFLVVWDYDRKAPTPDKDLWIQLLNSRLGTVNSPELLVTQAKHSNPRIIWRESEKQWVVFYQACSSGCIRAKSVNTGGVISNTTHKIALPGKIVDIKPNPSTLGFLVMYQLPNSAIRIARLNRNFSTHQTSIRLDCEEVGYAGQLIFNRDHGEFFAVWGYRHEDSSSKDIYAQRIKSIPTGLNCTSGLN